MKYLLGRSVAACDKLLAQLCDGGHERGSPCATGDFAAFACLGLKCLMISTCSPLPSMSIFVKVHSSKLLTVAKQFVTQLAQYCSTHTNNSPPKTFRALFDTKIYHRDSCGTAFYQHKRHCDTRIFQQRRGTVPMIFDSSQANSHLVIGILSMPDRHRYITGSKLRWSSGRIRPCHGRDPSSILGRSSKYLCNCHVVACHN
jgi:hypothetical protein